MLSSFCLGISPQVSERRNEISKLHNPHACVVSQWNKQASAWLDVQVLVALLLFVDVLRKSREMGEKQISSTDWLSPRSVGVA